MLKDPLPQQIDPYRLAAHHTLLEGYVLINDMERLRAIIGEQAGQIDVVLNFDSDEEGVCRAKGRVGGNFKLVCQRCLEKFTYPINENITLGIVSSEEKAKQLPKQYDPVLTEDNVLFIQQVIEDGLMVSLPPVPMHIPEDCQMKMPYQVGPYHLPENDNPFKILLSKKEDPHKN